jgi:lysophospholipase L1-like esterase
VLFSNVVKIEKALALVTLVILPACGGGSSSPTDPGGPVPTPAPGHPVSGVVFYDVNANGTLDPAETVRLPGVTVGIGGQTGETASGGQFTVTDVPAGEQEAEAQASGLPAYFRPGVPVTVSVPQTGGEIAVPATLEIGSNRPNHYLGFGDSITWGVGGGVGGGYQSYLEADLRSYWGEAFLGNAGDPGTRSSRGAERIGQSLQGFRGAYTLILYGTNDWNDSACRVDFPCFTISSLQSMIRQTRNWGSNPIVGTIPPANPAYLDRNATARNAWIEDMNDLIRAMAREEGVRVAEIHGDFMEQPSLESLFVDHVHPNDTGYQLMARSWFRAITRPEAATASSREHSSGFGFAPPEAP